MAGALEHFENAAHDLVAAVDRLVRIGVGADRDRARLIVWRGKLALEQFRRLRLHEQLGFEIEPRREPEIGVGGARETIDAAVLATAIGIDRAIEADIGRVVAGDDLARRIDRHTRGERRQILETLPAVVEADAGFRLVAPGRVRQRAAAAPALAVDLGGEAARRRVEARRRASQGRGASHGRMLKQPREQNKNDIAENIRIFCRHNELILLGFRAKREISQGRLAEPEPSRRHAERRDRHK